MRIQCDQKVRLFFKIWTFGTMKISPIMSQTSQRNHQKFAKDVVKFCQSGHTVEELLSVQELRCL